MAFGFLACLYRYFYSHTLYTVQSVFCTICYLHLRSRSTSQSSSHPSAVWPSAVCPQPGALASTSPCTPYRPPPTTLFFLVLPSPPTRPSSVVAFLFHPIHICSASSRRLLFFSPFFFASFSYILSRLLFRFFNSALYFPTRFKIKGPGLVNCQSVSSTLAGPIRNHRVPFLPSYDSSSQPV